LLSGYEITREGKVFSSTNWRGYGKRELAQHPNYYGYPSVRVVIDGKRVRYTVHSLVAAAYLPAKQSDDHEVRHLDGNKMNSHADNLAWGTAKDNADDRELHGRTSRGESHSKAIKMSNHSQNVKRGADHYHTKARAAIKKAEDNENA